MSPVSKPPVLRHRAPASVWLAALAYFGVVFGAGVLFGTLRTLWVAPALGQRYAELLEMPFMLLVVVLAARWVVARFRIPARLPPRLGVGLGALALVLAAELLLVRPLRGLGPEAYVEGRDPVAAAAYYTSLAIFAVVPVLVSRR